MSNVFRCRGESENAQINGIYSSRSSHRLLSYVTDYDNPLDCVGTLEPEVGRTRKLRPLLSEEVKSNLEVVRLPRNLYGQVPSGGV